nr:hypothetical protein [Tanacetum cinerariifolium]
DDGDDDDGDSSGYDADDEDEDKEEEHLDPADSTRVDLLMGDMMTLQETVWIVEEEAYAAREAWAHSVGLIQT